MSTETLRSFRRNAVHVRQALDLPQDATVKMNVDGGYLQDASVIERYKRLSIPVRRALNPTDRAAFAPALAALGEANGPAAEGLRGIEQAWQRLQQELDSTIGFGGSKVPRRQILAGWLNAAAFYDKLERDRAYDRLMSEWGTAAESIGSQLTEEAARVILLLDEAVAAVLGEPVILPPPPKTPPPPPDPRESLWTRLFRRKPRDE